MSFQSICDVWAFRDLNHVLSSFMAFFYLLCKVPFQGSAAALFIPVKLQKCFVCGLQNFNQPIYQHVYQHGGGEFSLFG